MSFVRFLHLVGLGLWLGAGGAAALLARLAAGDPPERRADRLELVGRLFGWMVAPGAVLTTASGIALTMMAASAGYGSRLGTPASAAMQVLGLVAAGLEILVSFPSSQRLMRAVLAAQGPELAGAGERMRRRLTLLAPITIGLVVVATFLGVIATPHD
jgi:uncharacterized membrane protein